jgi:hypothetical protein
VGEWICECADDACHDRMEMTEPEYESIRRHSNRFPVLPGHERPGLERVVERHDRYFVVEEIEVAAHVGG